MQAQSICKVKVQLKDTKDHVTAIALSESSRVCGINLEDGLYHTHKGKSEVFVINTLHTDISLQKGTELGRFQVSKTIEEINNHEICDDNKQTQVFTVQESIQSEAYIKHHVTPTSRPDLEGDLIKLLFLHKPAVALPGDALGKTTELQHKIKLKPGTQPLSENGFKYLLVIIDYFSRFCILQPIPNKKAETIPSTLFEKVICVFSTPKTIITDNGPEFINAILAEICRLFKIKKVNIHAYKPESNGVVERINRKVITCLRTLIIPTAFHGTPRSLMSHVP